MARSTKKPASTASRAPRLARDAREERLIRARYDAAQTTPDNRRLYLGADDLSAEAANSLAVRKILRRRCRHEVANNPTLDGVLDTIANDTVGTGPTPQLLTDDENLNSWLEEEFSSWMQATGMAEKLRTMRRSRIETGEVYAVFVTNPGLDTEVKLDVQLIEADRQTDPTWQSVSDPTWCDGIRYDEYGNPLCYRFLKAHPGSEWLGISSLEYEDISARVVFHYFRAKRPEQRRGIPELTSSLPNWPELRRYCNAVIAAAETAADYALTIESQGPALDPEEANDPSPMDEVELKRRMATVLPKGWRMSQTKAEQPTTSYGEFTDKKLAESTRGLNVPFTIAALDSKTANLSARYLDSQIYAGGIKIERSELARFMDRAMDAFITEAIRIEGYIPFAIPGRIRRRWYWPRIVTHADPSKVASAAESRIRAGISSIPDEIAEEGLDWEDVQQKNAKALGVTVEEYRALLRQKYFGGGGMQPPAAPRPLETDEDDDGPDTEDEPDEDQGDASSSLDLMGIADEGGGRWVTVNGTPVYIKDGEITKGPASLTRKGGGESSGKGGSGGGKGGPPPTVPDVPGDTFIPKGRVINIDNSNHVAQRRGYKIGSAQYVPGKRHSNFKVTRPDGSTTIVDGKTLKKWLSTPPSAAGAL